MVVYKSFRNTCPDGQSIAFPSKDAAEVLVSKSFSQAADNLRHAGVCYRERLMRPDGVSVEIWGHHDHAGQIDGSYILIWEE